MFTPEPAYTGPRAEPPIPSTPAAADDFEIVMGRRQIASMTFLMLVIMAVAAGGSYLLGKAVTVAEANTKRPAAAPAPMPVAVPEPPPLPLIEKPLYAEPVQGVVYIQMGAVERGVAEIFSEGLRKRGFDSFVAPGPSERVFRVLIGPFRSAEEYQVAKKSLDTMGLDTFARRYEQ